MLTKIKFTALILLTGWLLSSCISPLDTGTNETYIQPLDLKEGNSWVFSIIENRGGYVDSFYVRDTKLITYNELTENVYRVSFPALQHLNTDTLLIKYWQLKNNKLLEYGWEKRSRYSSKAEYAAQIYPQVLTIADFTTTTYTKLFDNNILSIIQKGINYVTINEVAKQAIPVTYRSLDNWYGFPECDFTLYFGDQQPLQIYGSIHGSFFSGIAQTKQKLTATNQ